MLMRLQRFAIRLQPFRHLLLLIAAVAFAGAAYFLLWRPQAEDQYLIPLIALFAWALMLYAFAMLFVQVPPLPQPDMGLLARFKLRLQRLLYWILAVAMLGVSAFLMLTTWQLTTAWRMLF